MEKKNYQQNRIRIKPIKYQTGNNYHEQHKANLQNDKKEFLNVIKKTLILHQQRRDGNIFNCYISDAKQLCTDKEIFQNCTQILDRLSNIQEYEPKPIPQLRELSQEEVEYMQNKMAYDKAISYDGITHQFIRDCNQKIINDIWNKNTFEVNKKLGWVKNQDKQAQLQKEKEIKRKQTLQSKFKRKSQLLLETQKEVHDIANKIQQNQSQH